MTPREEFEKDIVSLQMRSIYLNCQMQEEQLCLNNDQRSRNQQEYIKGLRYLRSVFFNKWFPKNTLEKEERHDTLKECDGVNNDCKDKDSIHYWMCHMTQEEFEQRIQNRKKTPFKLNKIEKPVNVNLGGRSLVLYDDLVIIAAFRYCLGRRSYIVSHMVDYLKNHWRTIDQKTKKLIFREIEEAISNGCAGDDCDMESWKFILALRKDDT